MVGADNYASNDTSQIQMRQSTSPSQVGSIPMKNRLAKNNPMTVEEMRLNKKLLSEIK